MHVTITGGTGALGHALARTLSAEGHAVTVTSRSAPNAVHWSPGQEPLPQEAFQNTDVLVHLVGEPLLNRWTPGKKQRIWDSRVQSTRHLIDGLERGAREGAPLPRVLLSASAIGYYGDTGNTPTDETAPPGKGFLSELSVAWEHEARRAQNLGLRTVQLRTGLVLDPGHGLLKLMRLPFQLGLGGRLGHGRQWMSWIHRDDWTGLVAWCLQASVEGPVNLTAPEAVQNREFTNTLASVLHRPAPFPVPAWALRLALGEMGDNALESQRIVPRAAVQGGYRFTFPLLRGALTHLLG